MIIRPQAVTFRYRVARIYGGDAHRGIATEVPREFKTLEAAERYLEKVSEERGVIGLLQVGVVQWLTPDDASELAMQLQHDGRPFE